MPELIAVAIITILAVISPGADFALVTRNSYLYGRHAGLLAAIGIALGVQVHVTYTMLGVGLLITNSPGLFTLIKIFGALYLVYIGGKTFVARPVTDIDPLAKAPASKVGSLRAGFMINVFNPKTTLFVVSVYTQVVGVSTSLSAQIGYGLFMSFAHGLWFSLVALFFSNTRLRLRMLKSQSTLNRIIGVILVSLGIALVFLPAPS